ncbi:MAG: methylmalonyl Co-A mutase-associated GTPase MeaB [Calditerrivibrio sp.]|nr:methylmalonyl Co-A mutase-associated GTPase MeaB [Calditerrivibrio sp.]MCA1933111.1 methylmalonyl Co-A mutase-associated GTPase MeaB [Calditerrivibrio sp.]MCA1980025.1 methylmalonyl Co-A mutase-associated GTPase MeaB [Calditerrivibrio sp.]
MDVSHLFSGVLSGNRRHLAKSITLIESKKETDKTKASELLTMIMPYTGKSIRIGISGVPGAGKSTFIEALGKFIISKGHKVAVLAVDPSSQISGGSILGDKTRMEELTKEENAFIRPSPSGDSLGGVARKTREAMLLCEAAGYDYILVETVGVGQSEISVANMVDLFTLIQLPNAGDELQGMKRGIMEMADIILINKSEAENRSKAEIAKKQIEFALHLTISKNELWNCEVMLVSALTGYGIKEYVEKIEDFINKMKASGIFYDKRGEQNISWMWSHIMDTMKDNFISNNRVKGVLKEFQEKVREGKINPTIAGEELLKCFYSSIK